jgi:prepilin-type processing-associated H-X9-DG protein
MRAPFPNPGDATFSGRSAGTQGYRHRNKTTNACFADGHAESLADRHTHCADATPAQIAPGTGFLSPDNSAYATE